MKISLATNFDDDLIEQIKDYPVFEVYGKLNQDIVGGGRPTNYLKGVEFERLKAHIAKVRQFGINFNYLLNSACISNLNQNDEWNTQLYKFLKSLIEFGVNAFTVTNPYLVEFIRKKFGNEIIIRVSSFACVDNYEKAKFWEKMGVNIICVDFCKVNRNFSMLKYMVENLNCEIELLCTNSCLKDCPMIHTHVNDIAHASSLNSNSGNYEDWGLNFCQEYQLNNLYEYIKSPWIRPEDISEYEKIGIKHFKITETDFPTSVLVKRVKAFFNRKYDGNLLDLIQGSGVIANDNLNHQKRYTFLSRKDVVEEIKKVRGIGTAREMNRHIYIDNKKLPPNFIDFFVNNRCSGFCDKCNYCKNISEKVIVEDKEVSDYLKFLYNKFNELKY